MTNEFDFDFAIIEFVANELEKKNIPVLRTQDGTPDVGPGLYNGKDGFYFRHPDLNGFYDEVPVSKLFPMGVGAYTVFLASITFPEAEDDRVWPASIGCTVIYNED